MRVGLAIGVALLVAACGTGDPAPTMRGPAKLAEYRLTRDVDGAFIGDNPAQRFRARVDPEGVSVDSAVESFRASLHTVAIRCGEETLAVVRGDSIRPDVSRPRVLAARFAAGRAFDEWYTNTPAGVEHGYTLRGDPCDGLAGDVVVEIRVAGLAASGSGTVVLRDHEGAPRARYWDASAADARGRRLDTSLVAVDRDTIEIRVDTRRAEWPVEIDPYLASGEATLVAGDPSQGDQFGYAVAVSGDLAIAGAPGDDDVPITTNQSIGSFYWFRRSGTTWSQATKLRASDAAPGRQFGWSLAASGDTVIVGERMGAVGAAYLFVDTGTSLSEQAKLTANDGASSDLFGDSVAIDGDTAIVGADEDDFPGVADQGSAYVFVRSGTTWSQQFKLSAQTGGAANDGFGWATAVSGDTALIGTASKGMAYVFVRSGTSWAQETSFSIPGVQFARAVALSGDTALIGARSDTVAGVAQGTAYVFVRNGTTWTQQTRLFAGDGIGGDGFGTTVALDGDTAVVGADSSISRAAVYVFVRSGSTWTEKAKITEAQSGGQDGYGDAVAIDGDTALVGAYLQGGTTTPTYKGAAFVYRIREVGMPCTLPTDCATGFCVDQVCCSTACSGACDECTAAKGASADGVCTVLPAGSPGSPACDPQICNGTSAACAPCVADANCASSQYCSSAGVCQPSGSVGDACSSTSCKVSGCRLCAAGTSGCVDGFCCDAPCSGVCDRCSKALGGSADGTCGVVTDGTTPVGGSCRYLCNGTSATCPTTCAGDEDCQQFYYCDATGTCVAQKSGACDTSAAGCKVPGCRVCSAGYSCVGGVCCSTNCKKLDGQACTGNTACVSGHCVAGICCNAACTGVCEACGTGVCTPKVSGTPCGSGLLCDGSNGVCPTGCTSDAQCASGSYCDGTGKCASQNSDGAQCTADHECTSAHCQDGVCCSSICSGCNACSAALKETGGDGTCGPAKKNTDPHASCQAEPQTGCGQTGDCDGSGACQFFSDLSASCGPTSCSGNAVTGSVCTGPRVCGATLGIDCGQLRCQSGACQPCTTSADCLDPTNYFCDAGDCKPLRSKGSGCASDGQCASGFCTDGVCCESRCDGQCEWCGNLFSQGSCIATPTGPPKGGRPACVASGPCGSACDGTTRTACVSAPPGTCSGTGGAGSGGVPGTGGEAGAGGVPNAGGALVTGGVPSSGGSTPGGSPGVGGAMPGAGGAAGSSGVSSQAGGSPARAELPTWSDPRRVYTGDDSAGAHDPSGCGCRVPSKRGVRHTLDASVAALALIILARRRTRRTRDAVPVALASTVRNGMFAAIRAAAAGSVLAGCANFIGADFGEYQYRASDAGPAGGGAAACLAPATNPCDGCVKAKCCGTWLACNDDVCQGNGTGSNLGESHCVQQCIARAANGTPLYSMEAAETCANACAVTGGALQPNTRAFMSCVSAKTGCGSECFGAVVAP